jgi:hypothetical protein
VLIGHRLTTVDLIFCFPEITQRFDFFQELLVLVDWNDNGGGTASLGQNERPPGRSDQLRQ